MLTSTSGSYVHKTTPSPVIVTTQVTQIPARTKMGKAYKVKMPPFYSTFARQLCDDTNLPGWLSLFSTCALANIQAHSSKKDFEQQIGMQPSHNLSSVLLLF